MRGIAALIVVLSHFKHVLRNANELAGAHWDEWLLSWPIRLLWGGDEALIGFFVLSGFVLASSLLRPGRPPWLAFLSRRIVRLYPAYLAALLISACCAWALHEHRTDRLDFLLGGYPKAGVTGPVFTGYALLLIDLNDINPALWALVQAIRLSLIFPAIFIAIRYLRTGPALLLSVALSVMLTTIIAHASLLGDSLGDWGRIAISLLKTGYFLFFFVLGGTLAIHQDWLLRRLAGPWRDGRLAFAVLGVGLLGMKWYLPYLTGPLVVGVGFAVILLVTLATPPVVSALRSPALRFLGTISYSLFLIHLPVMYLMVYLLDSMMPIAAVLLTSFCVAVLCAWLLHGAVERPSIGWARRLSQP